MRTGSLHEVGDRIKALCSSLDKSDEYLNSGNGSEWRKKHFGDGLVNGWRYGEMEESKIT